MKALGGRSPYEVVTGLKPKLPSGLDVSQPVRHASLDQYADRLQKYFTETFANVRRVQSEARDELEQKAGCYLSSELFVGDICLADATSN